MKQSLTASPGIFHAFRLPPHEDLKAAVVNYARENNIRAGAIVTCVGSIEHMELRFANKTTPFVSEGPFEILSLCGTFSPTAAHLHMTVADKKGETLGGHVLNNNLIFTTAEIIIVALTDLAFERQQDDTYGYLELIVKQARG